MEAEIIEIISDRADQGARLNLLVDEFRRSRDVCELLPLLRSENAAVVSVVAWIFSELPEELYSAEEFVSALRDLTGHADAMVRFHALSAVFPFLKAGDAITRTLLTRLMEDQNAGVRQIANAAAERLFIS